MRVALTGATGYVGGFILGDLLRRGVQVAALTRQRPQSDSAPVDWIRGDLSNSAALTELLAGADALVHCAYSHVPGRYRGGEGDDRHGFWRTNLLGSVALFEQARAAGVGRVVFLSSRAVYGHRTASPMRGASPSRSPAEGSFLARGTPSRSPAEGSFLARGTPSRSPAEGSAWVDETVRPVPDTYYGALKLALEAQVSALAAVDGVCAASLRPTGVYGVAQPVARSKWFDLAVAIAKGQRLPAPRRATEVHGSDVASAVWLLLTEPAEVIAGRAFNCSDLVVDTSAVAAKLAACMGRQLPALPPAANSLRHAMRTSALRQLGWRPGGERLLEATLAELAALAAKAR